MHEGQGSERRNKKGRKPFTIAHTHTHITINTRQPSRRKARMKKKTTARIRTRTRCWINNGRMGSYNQEKKKNRTRENAHGTVNAQRVRALIQRTKNKPSFSAHTHSPRQCWLLLLLLLLLLLFANVCCCCCCCCCSVAAALLLRSSTVAY